MMRVFRFILILFCMAQTLPACAWYASGHRLVAQIAYDHMTPKARKQFIHYNQQLDSHFRPQLFVNAAAWMDSLRYMQNKWLMNYHYIDIPYTVDGMRGKKQGKINAVSVIQSAKQVIANPHASGYDKGFSTRILLHVIGDLHQPLHAINRISKAHPKGDAGGNFFPLGKNPIGMNLHAYWDAAGGYAPQHQRLSSAELKAKAHAIERQWPCKKWLAAKELNPRQWSEQSHQLARNKAYSIQPGATPDKRYQQMVIQTSKKQMALAGCRLAATLNQLA